MDWWEHSYLHPYLPVPHDYQIEKCHHSIRIIIEIKKQIAIFCQEEYSKNNFYHSNNSISEARNWPVLKFRFGC